MAKKSMILKSQRTPKFSTQQHNRCKLCGRPHAYIRKYGICRLCFRDLAYKGEIPGQSNLKKSIAKILLDEGYIESYELVEGNTQGIIRVTLKYSGKKHVISGIKRISKPGLRTYADKASLPRVLNGLGIAIVSTSKGLMTDKEARTLNVGGEVLCYIS